MAGATVDPAQLHSQSPDGDVFIHGSYKSYIRIESETNPIDAKVTLSQPEILQTVVLVAYSFNQNSADRIGDSVFVLRNSAGVDLVSKVDVYDTGVYTLTTPAEAASLIIRRQSGNGYLFLMHVRAYQSTNLMQYATIHY